METSNYLANEENQTSVKVWLQKLLFTILAVVIASITYNLVNNAVVALCVGLATTMVITLFVMTASQLPNELGAIFFSVFYSLGTVATISLPIIGLVMWQGPLAGAIILSIYSALAPAYTRYPQASLEQNLISGVVQMVVAWLGFNTATPL